jgi:hypothetical protein
LYSPVHKVDIIDIHQPTILGLSVWIVGSVSEGGITVREEIVLENSAKIREK